METVRFRAWNEARRTMHHFDLRHLGNNQHYLGYWQCLDPDCGVFCDPTDYSDIELYTGLTDKDDRLIYEGDIIRFPKGSEYPATRDVACTFEITHDGGCSYSMVGMKPDELEGSDYAMADSDLTNCKVIGNIHEAIKS